MLAGVVELVLRLTIAEEKIELSVPISSAVCVCVTTCTAFLMRVCVCVSAHMFLFVHTSFACVARAELQRRTQL